MRTISVVTVGRSDYGIYQPILRMIQDDSELRLRLIVAGMHLSPEFGLTVSQIERDGFEIAERVEMLVSSDTPQAIGSSMGLGTMGFAQVYGRGRPDILLVLGDRFEMHAAAVAAVPFVMPIAHLHGGEITEGAIDEGFRHSMTKLSHLHFVSTEESARRVMQMGEEPWRVIVSGAPALDHLGHITPLAPHELEERYGLQLDREPVLVTFHPVTLEYEQTEGQVRELLEALNGIDRPVIFTMPNADTNGRIIMRMIEAFAATRPRVRIIENLGTEGYFSLMAHAAVMVGNSSSGIVEAPSFALPVVNIGTRQQGRLRAGNVIDVGASRQEITGGIHRALAAGFRESLRGMANPYGNGNASEIIVRELKRVPLDERLVRKRFVDLEIEAVSPPPLKVVG